MQPNTSLATGVMHMDLLRPPDDHQMFFGPYDDVPNPDAYSPIISESIFCAPCHQGSFWGVDIYESYSEWLVSAYAKQGVSCQDCHMTPDGITTNFAPDKGGVERDPLTIPTHKQFGSRDDAFLASSVNMQTTAAKKSGILRVKVTIKNIGAGHHIPTDQPMRNMILLVKTIDALGNELNYLGDKKVPTWGGRGDPVDGNYEGFPGKGFAKILFEPNPLYNSQQVSLKGRHVFPAPQWRVVEIKEDTRIAALATDVSAYEFDLSNVQGPVTLESRLIYRRTFKNWAKMKKFALKDIVLATNTFEFDLDTGNPIKLTKGLP